MILNYCRNLSVPFFVFVFVSLLIGGFMSSVSFAANSTVRVGYPQPSGAMLPLWLVSEAKLDLKYGVAVQNIFISGAARMNQSMVAGDIDPQIPSVIACSARSGHDHRDSGKPLSRGGVQAIALTRATWTAVNFGRRPDRFASASDAAPGAAHQR